MDLADSSLVLVADGRRARLFEEPVRGGPLVELTPEWPVSSEWVRPRARVRVHGRYGSMTHIAGSLDPRERAEDAFLTGVAARTVEIARDGRHHGMVVLAPPRALGRLRRCLARHKRAVDCAEPHDRLDADPETLRALVRALRLG